jgi:hypothetical protein
MKRIRRHLKVDLRQRLAKVARRVIRFGLAERGTEERVWQQRMAALERLRQMREGAPCYAGDLIAESREERESESDQLRTKE